VIAMNEVATILYRLRTAAGFDGQESPRCSPPTPVKPENLRTMAQTDRLTRWAGSDAKRWKKLHTALLRIYAPRWDGSDSRDILVAWVAAWLAQTKAEGELARLKSRRPPLTPVECNTKIGRQADLHFWGSLASRLEVPASVALSEDAEAAKVLSVFLSGDESEVDASNAGQRCS
jgi:hypothetical protein